MSAAMMAMSESSRILLSSANRFLCKSPLNVYVIARQTFVSRAVTLLAKRTLWKATLNSKVFDELWQVEAKHLSLRD
jgi:hypothetical protein